MNSFDTALSKAISHALRHEPWLYELELDKEGWVSLECLLEALRKKAAGNWSSLTRADIERVVAVSDKMRHELNAGRIRAIYGHSLPGKLRREVATPPARLFHGTSPDAVPMILRDGLSPMDRQYVHLSTDVETATAVGARKAKQPVILEIAAAAASVAGVVFYMGNDKVWLADSVPANFVSICCAI